MQLTHDQKTYLMGLLEQESEGLNKVDDVETKEEYVLIDQCQEIIQASIDNRVINTIEIVWCIEDIKNEASNIDKNLSNEECKQILESLQGNTVITWEDITDRINNILDERKV